MSDSLDLAQILGFVAQTLSQKREDLNAADTYNHDHGDHVVQVFDLAAKVARENPNLEPADVLARASQMLQQQSTGTAQAYAQTMAQGAQQLKGKQLTQQTLPLLIHALLGAAPAGNQPQQAQPQNNQGGGLLGGLLGALEGNNSAQGQQQPQAQGGGDLLGGLLGALTGGGQQGAQGGGLSDGLGLDDLVRAGSAFLQASQSGANTTDAALSALAAATGIGQTPHRAESAKIVLQALMQAAQQFGGK